MDAQYTTHINMADAADGHDPDTDVIREMERAGDGRGVFAAAEGDPKPVKIRGCKRPKGRHHQAAIAVEQFVAGDFPSLESLVDSLDPENHLYAKRAYGRTDDDTCGSNRILDLFVRSCSQETGAGPELAQYLASNQGSGHLKWLIEKRGDADREYARSFQKADDARRRRDGDADGTGDAQASSSRAQSSGSRSWGSSGSWQHDNAKWRGKNWGWKGKWKR